MGGRGAHVPAAGEGIDIEGGGGVYGLSGAEGLLLGESARRGRKGEKRAGAAGAGPGDGNGHVLAEEALVGACGSPGFGALGGGACSVALPHVDVRILAGTDYVLTV